jgi:hypothetical protein
MFTIGLRFRFWTVPAGCCATVRPPASPASPVLPGTSGTAKNAGEDRPAQALRQSVAVAPSNLGEEDLGEGAAFASLVAVRVGRDVP